MQPGWLIVQQRKESGPHIGRGTGCRQHVHAHPPDSELAMNGASKWGARLTPPAMQLPTAARLSLHTHQRQNNTSRNTASRHGHETHQPNCWHQGGIDVVSEHQHPGLESEHPSTTVSGWCAGGCSSGHFELLPFQILEKLTYGGSDTHDRICPKI